MSGPTARQIEVVEAVRRHSGHQAAAAAELGVSRPTVTRAVALYELRSGSTAFIEVPRARTTFQPDAFASNIARAVDRLTPEQLDEGRIWWPRAAAEIAWLADFYGVPYRTLAYAAAALSPGIRWTATLDSLRLLLDARAAGETAYPRGIGHLTFGYRDRAKAWLIITGPRDAWQACRGPKVEAIAANLMGDLNEVAVDRHIVRVATASDRRQVSPATIVKIAGAVRLLAVIRGLRPAELQAALWAVGSGS